MEEGNDPNYLEKLKEKQKGRFQFFKQAPKKTKVESQTQPTQIIEDEPEIKVETKAVVKTPVSSGSPKERKKPPKERKKTPVSSGSRKEKKVVKSPVSSDSPKGRKRKDYWDPPNKAIFRDVTGVWTTAAEKQHEIDVRNRFKALLPEWDDPDSEYWKFDSD